jgi:hypothetical protein
MSTARPIAERVSRVLDWQVGLLRATAFCLAPPDLSGIKWWEELVGAPAEVRNVRAGAGHLIEQGLVENRSLQLQIVLARVDWIFTAREDPEGDGFPQLGPFEESVRPFQSLISRWLEAAPSLNRLAFGAQLYIPSSNVTEARGHIARILPYVRLDWEHIRDFVFRVNRPRPFVAWPEVGELNRIATVGAVSRKKLVATLLPEPQMAIPAKEEFAASLELDINMPPLDVRQEIPRERRIQIFDELVSNGREIAERGILDEHGN